MDNFSKISLEKCNGHRITNLEKYAYQIIELEYKKAEYIYVNAFRTDNPNESRRKDYWKTQAVNVCDGGYSYWGILFNTETQDFSDLSINGPLPRFLF